MHVLARNLASRNAIPVLLVLGAMSCGTPAEPSAPPPPPPPTAPASVAIGAGNLQTAAAGTAVADPVTVLVRDAAGTPLRGRTVQFTVTASPAWQSFRRIGRCRTAGGQLCRRARHGNQPPALRGSGGEGAGGVPGGRAVRSEQ